MMSRAKTLVRETLLLVVPALKEAQECEFAGMVSSQCPQALAKVCCALVELLEETERLEGELGETRRELERFRSGGKPPDEEERVRAMHRSRPPGERCLACSSLLGACQVCLSAFRVPRA